MPERERKDLDATDLDAAILALAKAVAALQAEKDDHGWGSAEAHRAVILLARAVFGFKMALRSSL